MTPTGFRQLVCQAQAGHGESIERLLALTRPLVVRAVGSDPARIPHADESVEDLAQNVCLRVIRKLKYFKGTAAQAFEEARTKSADETDDDLVWKLFRSWLRRTSRRIVLNDRDKFMRRGSIARQTQLQNTADSDGSTPQGDHEPKAPGPTPSSEARSNERVRRILEAIGKIPDPLDREIVRLRYLEERSLHEIAGLLNLSYDVTRARHRRSKKGLEEELKDLI